MTTERTESTAHEPSAPILVRTSDLGPEHYELIAHALRGRIILGQAPNRRATIPFGLSGGYLLTIAEDGRMDLHEGEEVTTIDQGDHGMIIRDGAVELLAQVKPDNGYRTDLIRLTPDNGLTREDNILIGEQPDPFVVRAASMVTTGYANQ